MGIGNYLKSIGYGGENIPDLSRGRNADYFGLYGDVRAAEFLRQQGQEGFLSPGSVNPQVRQLVEGGVSSERFRQDNLSRSLAAAGVNETMANRIIEEGEAKSRENISSQTAGFEAQRQQREFKAGEDFISFSSAIEAETTRRAEDARRYRKAQREAKKAQRWGKLMSVASLALTAIGGPLGGMIGAGLSKALGGGKGGGDTLGGSGLNKDFAEFSGGPNPSFDPMASMQRPGDLGFGSPVQGFTGFPGSTQLSSPQFFGGGGFGGGVFGGGGYGGGSYQAPNFMQQRSPWQGFNSTPWQQSMDYGR